MAYSGRTIVAYAALLRSPGRSTRWPCPAPIVALGRCWVIQDVIQGLMVFGAIQGNRSFQRQSKNGYTPSPLLAEELHPRTLTLSRKVVSHLQCHLSLLALCNR